MGLLVYPDKKKKNQVVSGARSLGLRCTLGHGDSRGQQGAKILNDQQDEKETRTRIQAVQSYREQVRPARQSRKARHSGLGYVRRDPKVWPS